MTTVIFLRLDYGEICLNEIREIMIKALPQPESLVALFENHAQAAQAVSKLHENGFDMKSLSIIAVDLCAVENIEGYYSTVDRMKKWGEIGAFYGGFWGLLFGAATFFIPGIGPILIAGPIAAIVVALEGALAVGTLSAIGAALVSLGIPEKHALKYETEIKAGKYLLLARGDKMQINDARALLHVHLPKESAGETDWDQTQTLAIELHNKENGTAENDI
jgi:uncharacterized membrane protein